MGILRLYCDLRFELMICLGHSHHFDLSRFTENEVRSACVHFERALSVDPDNTFASMFLQKVSSKLF